MAISQYSKHQATDLDFMKCAGVDGPAEVDLTQGTLAPVIDLRCTPTPDLVKKFPYLPTLLKSIQTAVPRPVTPFYPAVTEAIETNVYAALQGQKSTTAALADMQTAI